VGQHRLNTGFLLPRRLSFTGPPAPPLSAPPLDCRAKLFAAAITKTGLKEVSGIKVEDLDAKDSEVFYVPDLYQAAYLTASVFPHATYCRLRQPAGLPPAVVATAADCSARFSAIPWVPPVTPRAPPPRSAR
jgi:hypothetical protein